MDVDDNDDEFFELSLENNSEAYAGVDPLKK
jgi:hypothetical protein